MLKRPEPVVEVFFENSRLKRTYKFTCPNEVLGRGSDLEYQRSRTKEPEISARECGTVDVQQILVHIFFFARRAIPGDVVLVHDRIAVAFRPAELIRKGRHCDVNEIGILARKVDELETREVVVVRTEDLTTTRGPSPV